MSTRTRTVDPGHCWIRHVAVTDDPDGVQAGGARFAAEPSDGINGRQGWIRAEITPSLADSGEGLVMLPNTVGDDGRLHRDRFRILTDPDYRVGDEWLEIMREPHDTLAVATPIDYSTSLPSITLKLRTAEVLTELDIGPDTERVIAAPRDVARRAGRTTIAAIATELTGKESGDAIPGPWLQTNLAGAPVTPYAATWAADGLTLTGSGSDPPTIAGELTTDATDWEAYANARVTTATSGGKPVQLAVLVDGTWNVLEVGTDGTISSSGLSQAITRTNRGRDLHLPGEIDLRIVKDGRWVQHIVNGNIICAVEAAAGDEPPTKVRISTGANQAAVWRRAGILTRPALLARDVAGDMHLPGKPTPGGLRGAYYDETTVTGYHATTAKRYASVLSPTTEPKNVRLDAGLNFSGTGWQPVGISDSAFSVRWTGAIYLDLETSDRMLRLNAVDDVARLWIGRTDWHDPAIDAWPYADGTQSDKRSPALRSYLGTSKAGWYPIVIEYAQGWGLSGNPGALSLQDTALSGGTPTTWNLVPPARLSPYGIVDETYQHEPRRKLLDDVADSFAIQWLLEPATLESGRFPGRIVPYVRAGRDTDLTIDTLEGVKPQVQGDALTACDRIIADAAGIAASGVSQLSAQAIAPPGAHKHIQLTTAYESLSDITEPALLEQRVSSLLALRGSPNEQVGVQPHGRREVVDSFPLAGDLQRFDWRPGDGVRLKLPEIGVVDEACRQIVAPTWTLTPDGVQSLQATFRQRPRNIRDTVRSLWRAALSPQRTYQGQLALLSGSAGGRGSVPGATDAVSRVSLPPGGIANVVQAWFVAEDQTAPETWTLEINGVTWGTIPKPGTYDVTGAFAGDAALPRAWARLTSSGGGNAQYKLLLLVRI